MGDKVVIIGLGLLVAALLLVPDWQATYETFLMTLSYHVYGDYQR